MKSGAGLKNNVKKDPKYKFHKWKRQLLIADKVITAIALLLLGLFRPDYVVIAAYFLLIPYLILTQRKTLFYHLIVSSAIALVWVIIAKKQYAYNHDFFVLAGINLYPLFAWALGLFTAYLIYSHYEHRFNLQNPAQKLALFTAFYVTMLIASETIAYHILDIRNIAAAAYSGLPLCECIHAPAWMQAAYFAMGPLFFAICYALKLENPHSKAKSMKSG
jgi:hypothetical protein